MHLPMGSALDGVVGFQPGDHFGNIGREYCSILAPLMDSGFRSLNDSALVSRYGLISYSLLYCTTKNSVIGDKVTA